MHFEIEFTGHQNISSLHEKTIEFTKESHLTPKGDCILGVNASCGCKDIPIEMKKILKNSNTVVRFSIKVNDYSIKIVGKGHNNLLLDDPNDIVLRKSEFICPRTLAISCDKSSVSIPRDMVQLLNDPNTKGTFLIEV
ncbi:MAG: hypothetical protein NPMRTHETA2_810010 [Nitrosopumilales archaeon]|nr:MAG: hypothetical protein NPMRTHETA2_810010 [Nitrosopumilales archaeon]